MFLGVQYYRPPFPDRRHWADDLSAIRDAGLDGIQLWCVWGWIEPEPGRLNYDDYDELVRLAGERGLKVVLSTVAEVQPFWIHRIEPDCSLEDHLQRPVISTPRAEVNVGLSPGGCFDHPGTAARMRGFLVDIARRYSGLAHIHGWDCWNETRWNVHADGLTCYCRHTIADFRAWLERRYGDLAGVSAAWKRRYASWEDVRPGKRTCGPFSDMMDFARYQSWRATRHCRWRYDALREGGVRQPITAHGPMPTIHTPPVLPECPVCRGNDWEMADVLDGVGSSTFPGVGQMDPAYVATRFNEVAAAAGGKALWWSEIQGFSGSVGYRSRKGSRCGHPLAQRRWVIDLLGRGYQTVIFWQWRDEKFCGEAGAGGLAGSDGLAGERIEGIRRTSAAIRRSAAVLRAYRPDRARVGVLFCPDNYYLNWAMTNEVWDVMHSVVGYAMALERQRIDYTFVESAHLDVLEGIDVLFMPFCQVLPAATRQAVLDLLARGGRVLVEAETDAYSETGFYREMDEREFPRAIGVSDLGRREMPAGEAMEIEIDGRKVSLPVGHFLTALRAAGSPEPGESEPGTRNQEHGGCPGGGSSPGSGFRAPGSEVFFVRQPAGKGVVWYLGGFAGKAYFDARNAGLEALVAAVCRDAGVTPAPEVRTDESGESKVRWRLGRSGGRRVLFLLNGDEEHAVRVELPGTAGVVALDATVADGAIVIAPGDAAMVELGGA